MAAWLLGWVVASGASGMCSTGCAVGRGAGWPGGFAVALAGDVVAGGGAPGECVVRVRLHGPVVGVGDAVVVWAEHCHLVGVSVSALVPGCDVMDYAPGGGGVTAGEHTASVAYGDGLALGGGGESSAAPERQWVLVFVDGEGL